MTRQQYIRRTLAAICGDRPAHPQEAHFVYRMADRVADVFRFDHEA